MGDKKGMAANAIDNKDEKVPVSSNEETKGSEKAEEQKDIFTPREYQIEILEEARKNNTIACLGTGTGKTFIAVLLIREMAHQVQPSFAEGGKRIFFLVPTVPLVDQQTKFIGTHTELKVKGYFGEMNVDAWDKDMWVKEFEEQQVLVMTGEVCRIILHHCFLSVSRICLLILDECHQARGNSPYSKVMEHIVTSGGEFKPRIFGLSASLINDKCKPHNLEKELKELEKTLQSSIVTANDYSSVLKYATDAKEYVILYRSFSTPPQFELVVLQMNSVFHELQSKEMKRKSSRMGTMEFQEDIVYKPEQCICHVLYILDTLGPWCAYIAAEMLCKGLKRALKRTNNDHAEAIVKVQGALQDFLNVCKRHGADNFVRSLFDLPHKLKRLIDTLVALKRRSEKLKEMENANKSTAIEADVIFEEDPQLYMQNLKASNESNLCGIIFVEQRIIAYVLSEFLRNFREIHDEFKFVKPNHIFGQGLSRYESSENFFMSAKKQNNIIKSFRDREFNFLVATSVLEEGLDVQKCNFVIRFDFPLNFRAYIQSKGRARARQSVYLLFVPSAERCKIFTDLTNYLSIERMLEKIDNERKVPIYETGEDGDTVPPYMPVTPVGSPRITASAAVSLLYRYCALLPCDTSVKLKPYFKVEAADPDAVVKKAICTLYLPINSSLHHPVVGPEMKTKKGARMAAALEVCKRLHEIGELDHHLLPVGRCVDLAAQELGVLEEEETDDGCKPGTTKRRQYYKKKVANVFKNSLPTSGVPCYLHVFLLDLIVPLPLCLNPRKRPIINPADTTRTFGILLTKKLPKVCKFPLFTKCGKILVDLKCVEKPIFLDEKSLQQIPKFHDFLFKDTLWLAVKNYIEFCPSISEFGCYIVPVNRDGGRNFFIDTDFIDFTLSNRYMEEKDMAFEEIPRKKFKAGDFEEAVVTKAYFKGNWVNEKPVFYHITQIRHDLSPGAKTMEIDHMQHYKRMYGVDIKYEGQPLLDVHMADILNKSKPIYITKKQAFQIEDDLLSKGQLCHKRFREYLVPELCLVHPFPDSLFRKATCIPTILFRLNALLIADDIRQEVAEAVHVGTVTLPEGSDWPTFHLETSDKALHEHLVSKGHIRDEHYGYSKESADIIKGQDGQIVNFVAKVDLTTHPGPSPSLLLQALTTKGANDEFDLERLEMIGDSFLKYATSVKLYSAYPTFDEGKLTSLRMKVIRNLNLYQLAKKKNLPESLFDASFCCNDPRKIAMRSRSRNLCTNWLPPCYTINNILRTAEMESKLFENNEEIDTCKQSGQKKKKQQTLKAAKEALHTHQLISDKCISDSVEALIGAYLLSCGQQGALRFMHWIGVSPFAQTDDDNRHVNFENWPPIPPHPLRKEEESEVQDMKNLFDFTAFENRIGYKFKQPAYLLQAFTHASYGISFNDMTDCYQRLEFLGDAVVDYLVTRTLYEDPKEHSPGKLTDLRTALVNNSYFASLAVKYGYNKNLKCMSITLLDQIRRYVEILENSKAYKHFQEFGYYLEEIESLDIDQEEVPKALGDLFESVAGAIYLDSGSSLDEVWRVYYPMMKPAIAHLSTHIPKSPVRLLYELTDDQLVFKRGSLVVKNEKTYIRIRLKDGHEFIGVGPNKKVAKKSAAKLALTHIKKKVDAMEVVP